jgi:hypothetical protein
MVSSPDALTVRPVPCRQNLDVRQTAETFKPFVDDIGDHDVDVLQVANTGKVRRPDLAVIDWYDHPLRFQNNRRFQLGLRKVGNGNPGLCDATGANEGRADGELFQVFCCERADQASANRSKLSPDQKVTHAWNIRHSFGDQGRIGQHGELSSRRSQGMGDLLDGRPTIQEDRFSVAELIQTETGNQLFGFGVLRSSRDYRLFSRRPNADSTTMGALQQALLLENCEILANGRFADTKDSRELGYAHFSSDGHQLCHLALTLVRKVWILDGIVRHPKNIAASYRNNQLETKTENIFVKVERNFSNRVFRN